MMSQARVFVPYTYIRDATQTYLADKTVEPRGTEITTVDVSAHKWAYTDYFQNRWDEGEDFVNLEHDIVPWPGAIDSIWRCREMWCFYGYLPGLDHVANGCAPFGLAKFSATLIAKTPDVWKEMRSYYDPDYEYVWTQCDIFLFSYAVRQHGIIPHQHTPPVFNAHPQRDLGRKEDNVGHP